MTIKTLILGLAIIAMTTFTGCLENDFELFDPVEKLNSDLLAIDNYLLENNIMAQIDTVYGIRFVIEKQGTGIYPTYTDSVTVNYEGNILGSEELFDEGDSVTFKLNQLIASWQIALPYLKAGGSMTIYSPSGYAYGNRQAGAIPPNSNLVFKLDLIRVQEND